MLTWRIGVPRLFLLAGLAALVWLARPTAAQPGGRVVTPQGTFVSLNEALAQAQDGDTVEVYGGAYAGPVVIDRRVTLVGHDWPVIDGGGRGTVVTITAPGAALQGFVVRNSGDSLDEENSGVVVEAAGVTVANNRLEATLFGIDLQQAPGSVVRDNVIDSLDLPIARRGDAIRVWYSNDVRIENNHIAQGRDVVLWYSERLTIANNEVSDSRYGLHFMYCDDATIAGNRFLNNSVGVFLMYSRRLRLENNLLAGNRGPSGYGLGMKDLDDALVSGNVFLDNRVGIFLDNSPREIDSVGRVENNVLAYNDIGLSLLPSVRHNYFTGNSFVDNQEQVSVEGGGRMAENWWSVDGRGNYWSDYAGYDADGNGIGDVPYHADRLFEDLLDRKAELRLFIFSPAAQAVDFAARAFPFVRPQPKLVDDSPAMAPAWPAGAPALPRPETQSLPWAVAALLLVALGLMGWTNLSAQPAKRPARVAAPGSTGGEKPMIDVQNLTKRFGKLAAVDHLSFEVKAGEAVALWGANGAGKTTALRCLLGVVPFEGTVRLAGYDVRYQGKKARQAVGFVPQELNFHDDLTVMETLRFYARLKKVSPAGLSDLLARLGLAVYQAKRVRDLSGGLKQRLALATALLADPPILALDEPTSNLDTGAREDFLTLLAELKAAGKTLIFSSHRLSEIVGLADRVLVLESGRLAADCPPHELASRAGWKAVLKLHLPGEWIEPAMATLSDHGFATSRNGRGIWVSVVPQEKAQPISLLARAGVPVEDFEMG
ncbi:MAG: nitrous oxide reductase family maturation protein NosD [Chloroflexi bacterium]|nr:nitrous oxide reductase family maturation protein NosD [Chloroflexota bacterium]MCI0577836.1 nitrous oxide reductase family maturation protein NosD [Chloroflexota bacterium]MCI0646133.1 nitrous oxide reductase family maturation protein NosD [Chloroflexota bacterium]MCI0731335.1 nitrous oxide reductase family maturation protein NosD [Chloroflexota bacterium]